MSAPGTKRTCRLRCAMSALRGKAENICSQRVFPLLTAGSTGRRNTGIKSLCWGFKLQGLTWPFVELTSHFVQMGLRVHRQVGALRKVLAQQAIVVLIRPPLPQALLIAKIDVHFRRPPNATIYRQVRPPI